MLTAVESQSSMADLWLSGPRLGRLLPNPPGSPPSAHEQFSTKSRYIETYIIHGLDYAAKIIEEFSDLTSVVMLGKNRDSATTFLPALCKSM